MRRKILIGTLIVIAILWGWNTSLFTKPSAGAGSKLIAHRGVHQTFDVKMVGRDDCTAGMITEPTHAYLENTVESMGAAFAYGADVVEIDIQPTADGSFVVFHDWTLGCRTNGFGDIREKSVAELQALDIGYGYTHDGGKTFPFRGDGVGKMPTLSQVFTEIPDGKFLINFKGNRSKEGRAFVSFMQENPQWQKSVWGVYGGARPTNITLLALNIRGYSRPSTKACLKGYMLKGWSGYVPKPCRNALVVVPQNYAKLMWGWPHKFTRRMEAVGSEVILLGPHSRDNAGSTGIDDTRLYASTPKGFEGYIWTNKIELIGPLSREIESGDN